MTEYVPQAPEKAPPEKFLELEKKSFWERLWKNYRAGIVALLGILLFFILWEVVQTYAPFIDPFIIPTASDVLEVLWQDIINGVLPSELAWSLRNYAAGYLIATATAIPIGLAMGSIPIVNRILSPYLWIGFVMPRIAFLPIVIIALGFGPEAKILFISISCFFPIIINTIAGVQTVSPSLIKVGRLFGGTRLQVYRKIIFPYAINFVLTGMRIAARTGLVVMYATEIFGSPAGIGAYVIEKSDVFVMEGAFAGLIVIVVTALVILTLFDYIDGLARPWRSEVSF
jgi:ABC-type nitrate/sulfonate/bicarbonate transport system permease component